MSPNCLWAVPINGSYPPRKKYVVKETPKTFVVSPFNNDAWLASTIRKATMSTSYERYYTDEESANKFYLQLQNSCGSKTADKMFEKMGYKIHIPDTSETPSNFNTIAVWYSKGKLEINFYRDGSVEKTWGDVEGEAFTLNEIKAVSKKLEEMGW